MTLAQNICINIEVISRSRSIYQCISISKENDTGSNVYIKSKLSFDKLT